MRNKHANEKGIDIPKIIFGCIVVLLLLFCSGVTAVELSEEDMTASMAGAESYDDIAFTDWTSSTSMPNVAGDYRLTRDVRINSQWSVRKGVTNIDLNGHSIIFTGEQGSVIYVGVYSENTTLNLYDGVGTGKITGGKGVYNGGGVHLIRGVFILYGGNIVDNNATSGGGVHVSNNATFIMYGGHIYNNTAAGEGGGVLIENSVFAMHGGSIFGNIASKEQYGSTSRGGGVHVRNSTFTMTGGFINENKASSGGGVYLSSIITYSPDGSPLSRPSKIIMTGGTITGNIAERSGGGVYVQGSWTHNGTSASPSNLTLSSGVISDNIAIYSDMNYIDLYDEIPDQYIINTPNNVYLGEGAFIKIDVSGIKSNTNVGVSTKEQPLKDGNSICVVDSGNVDCSAHIFADNPSYHLQKEGNNLYLGYGTLQDGKIIYLPQDISKFPTIPGVYRLTSDITFGNTSYFTNGETDFDLNGHTINFIGMDDDAIYVSESSTLNIYDSVGTGKITCGNDTMRTEGSTFHLGGIYIRGNCTLYGGSITGLPTTAVKVLGDGIFTMAGGAITNNSYDGLGGGVYSSGKFIMLDGIIAGNTANYGAGVYIGGTYRKDGDGYIVHNGTFIMSGGIITENTAKSYGGGLYVSNGTKTSVGPIIPPSSFTLLGGSITGNICFNLSNNVYLGNGRFIQIDTLHLPSTTKIGVTTGNVPTASTPIAITSVNDKDYSQYFISDNSSYHIENQNNVLYLVYGAPVPPIQPLPTSLLLSRGWNFISIPLPLAASCDTAGELFADLATSGTSPLGYDASSDAGWYILNRDTILKPLDGYWLYVEEPTTLNLAYADAAAAGSSAAASVPSKQVYKGWNAIGVSAKESVKAKDAFDGLSWVRYLPWNLNADAWGRVIVNGGSAAESEENYVGLGNGGWLYVEANGVYRGVRMYVPIN